MDNDWDWIEKFRAGDDQAFEEIFNRYRTRIFRIALRFVRDPHTAEDIAHDVFIKIYEKKLPTKHSAKFSTWLYRVTVNAAIDHLRKRKFLIPFTRLHSQVPDGSDPTGTGSDPTPADEAVKNEMDIRLRQELDRLPESLKSPLLLYTFEDLSYAEIAEILAISEKAVERRLARARGALRKKLISYL